MNLRVVGALLALAVAGPVAAQDTVTSGTGAILRGLDKLNAKVTDIVLQNGETEVLGLIDTALKDPRYPEGHPSGAPYAFLTLREAAVAQPLFSGWMIASSPALNAMDHARFDVWVLRCTLPD